MDILEYQIEINKKPKGVGITIKSKEASSKLATYVADHTNTVGRYTHACINDTHSSKSTKFIPYFGSYNYKQHKPAKVRIKSYGFARVGLI